MKIKWLLLLLCCSFTVLHAQAPGKYWIHFTDKNNSPYSIDRPQEFLSARALERRQKFQIPIDTTDLPVNQDYIAKVMQQDGNAVLLTRSKWMNGITVYSADPAFAEKVNRLPFVQEVEQTIRLDSAETFVRDTLFPYKTLTAPLASSKSAVPTDYDYGRSRQQLRLNNVHWLHRLGYTGKGMVMMVMDAGFCHVDTIAAFARLRNEGRLLGARNFVLPDENPFKHASHGTMVLSCIAAERPGKIIGTAPDAAFYLAKTEDERSENKIEEDNWAAGIEWADSLGVEVLNSSLGYTKFDDSLHHPRTYADMTGRTSRAAQAADMAINKGMIVCNSAGNEGSKEWHYLGTPADARNVLAVGATTALGSKASFSSFGPTADGRVKPDACATGSMSLVINTKGRTTFASGTSFASPLLSGMVACLWQAFPDKKNDEIIAAIRQAGSQYAQPDGALGYGITDFLKAYNLLYTTPLHFLQVNIPDFSIHNTLKINIISDKKQKITLLLKGRKSGTEIVKEKEVKSGEHQLSIKMPRIDTEYEIFDLQIVTKEGTQSFVIGAE